MYTKEGKIEKIRRGLIVIEQFVVFAYLFCMLGIFPLYYKEKYHQMGKVKFDFFWEVSLYFIGISLIFIVTEFILKKIIQVYYNKFRIEVPGGEKIVEEQTEIKKSSLKTKFLDFIESLSDLDYAVFLYAICVILSYAFSNYKELAYRGADGWEMGLCSQMLFVVTYFILSRQKIFVAAVIGIHLVTSAITFILGILHRFEIDPLGFYEGLSLYYKKMYLSTIGQSTWFSSYVCTLFMLGVIIFWLSKKLWIRIATGIYTVLSFACLVTQNSDSAFIAIVGIMLLLGYFSLQDIEKWCRFWQVICLMFGAFLGIGIFQKIFADKIIQLDRLSIFFSQSIVSWLVLIAGLGILFFYSKCKNKEREKIGEVMKITKKAYIVLLILFAAAIIMVIIFIYLNTKGYLLTWFGYQSKNNYLLFDRSWGNGRGSTWMICWEAYGFLPLYQKLFGIGPDSLAAYLYKVPYFSERLYYEWGNLIITNAHNEYLNSLLCYGIVGLASWLMVLGSGIVRFYKKAKENPFMIAFALCIMGYACHNIFCYQQVCCTPFLFLVLGIGESLTKSENFNTIK